MRFACAPQIPQVAKRAASGVPVLSTVAEEMAVISSISSGAWAIIGLAPMARSRLAQSFAVTMLEMQCTSGFRLRISFRIA